MSVDPTAAPPEFVRLISHPLRWRLVAELAHSDLRVRELCDRIGEPQNLLSYHLRLLRIGGLVVSRRSTFDGRDSYYHLDLDRCAEGLAHTAASLHPILHMGWSASPATRRPTVLFVCSGNSARSPIAAALLRHRAGDHLQVSSAGTHPKDRLHPHAIRVLRERYSIDIQGQTPRSLDLLHGRRFDHLITVCDKAREVLPDDGDSRRSHWSIPDPAAGGDGQTSYHQFVSTAAEIDTRVQHLIPALIRTPEAAAEAAAGKEERQ